MSVNLMKALRFAEFGPPSVLRIEEIRGQEGRRSTGSGESSGYQSERLQERLRTLQEHNSAANSWAGLCGHRCEGEGS